MSDTLKNCPYCDEEIKATESKCGYCNSILYNNNLGANLNNSSLRDQQHETEKQGNKQLNINAQSKVRKPKALTIMFLTLLAVIAVFVVISIISALLGQRGMVNKFPENDFVGESMISQIEEQQKQVYYAITEQGSNLYVRKTAGRTNKTAADIITKIPRGTEVEVLNKHNNTIRIDGFTWWEIKVSATNITGWVASEYLSTNSRDVY